MTDTALAEIRIYYPDAEVAPIMFRGERIGFGVYLEPEDDPIGLASDKKTAAKNARGILYRRRKHAGERMTDQPKDYPPSHLHEPWYEAASPQMRCAVCHESVYHCTCPCEGKAAGWYGAPLAQRENDDER